MFSRGTAVVEARFLRARAEIDQRHASEASRSAQIDDSAMVPRMTRHVGPLIMIARVWTAHIPAPAVRTHGLPENPCMPRQPPVRPVRRLVDRRQCDFVADAVSGTGEAVAGALQIPQPAIAAVGPKQADVSLRARPTIITHPIRLCSQPRSLPNGELARVNAPEWWRRW